jgi:hypothetical protein
MTIRITYKQPKIGDEPQKPGKYKQKRFTHIELAASWIVLNIPETERNMIKLWVSGVPITGATRTSALRPLPL